MSGMTTEEISDLIYDGYKDAVQRKLAVYFDSGTADEDTVEQNFARGMDILKARTIRAREILGVNQ